jgi:Protein of unknown function (DUF2934)
MNSNSKKSPVTAINDPQDLQLEDQIRKRAYELYQTRGKEPGHEQEDWFRAKEELAIKKFRTASA